MTYLPVDAATRDRVVRIAHLNGAHRDDSCDRAGDGDTALDLAAAIGSLTDLHETLAADSGPRSPVTVAFEDRVLKRATREIVERAWEKPRRRREGGPLLSNKYTYGAACSPDALRVLVDPATGGLAPANDVSGRLELEHVVPASTIVKLLSATVQQGQRGEQIARMLHECCIQVIVMAPKMKRHDQPRATILPTDVEQALIDHYTGEHRLTDDDLFNARWARYLDPMLRGDLDWTLDELTTVNATRAALAGDA